MTFNVLLTMVDYKKPTNNDGKEGWIKKNLKWKESTEEFLTLFTTSAFRLVSLLGLRLMCNLHFATTNTKVHGIFCVSFEAKNVLVSQDTTAVPVQNKLITKAVVFYEFLFMFFAADDSGSLREIFEQKYHGSEQMEFQQKYLFLEIRDNQWSMLYSFAMKKLDDCEIIVENWKFMPISTLL